MLCVGIAGTLGLLMGSCCRVWGVHVESPSTQGSVRLLRALSCAGPQLPPQPKETFPVLLLDASGF